MKQCVGTAFLMEGTMIKGIIFDFDGLLVDTESIWFDIFKEYFDSEHNYAFIKEDFVRFVGSSSGICEGFIRNFDENINCQNLMDKFRAEFNLRSKRLKMMKGAEALINEARNLDIKMVIATSSPYERPHTILKRLNMLQYFEAIIAKEDVEQTKPSPDLFLKAKSFLKLQADELIILEDSIIGVQAAKSSGIEVVMVPNDITKHSKISDDIKVVHSLACINLRELSNV